MGLVCLTRRLFTSFDKEIISSRTNLRRNRRRPLQRTMSEENVAFQMGLIEIVREIGSPNVSRRTSNVTFWVASSKNGRRCAEGGHDLAPDQGREWRKYDPCVFDDPSRIFPSQHKGFTIFCWLTTQNSLHESPEFSQDASIIFLHVINVCKPSTRT